MCKYTQSEKFSSRIKKPPKKPKINHTTETLAWLTAMNGLPKRIKGTSFPSIQCMKLLPHISRFSPGVEHLINWVSHPLREATPAAVHSARDAFNAFSTYCKITCWAFYSSEMKASSRSKSFILINICSCSRPHGASIPEISESNQASLSDPEQNV